MTARPMLAEYELPSADTLEAITRAAGETSLAESLAAAPDVTITRDARLRPASWAGRYRPDSAAVTVARAVWTGPSGYRHHLAVVQVVTVCRGEDASVYVEQHVVSGEVSPAQVDALVLLALAGLLAPRTVSFEL